MNELTTEVSPNLIVMKFGGTSVGGAKPIERVTSIIESHKRGDNNLVVVASAIRGITDRLVKICNYVKEQNIEEAKLDLEDVLYKHLEVTEGLSLPHPLRISLDEKITELFFDLHDFALAGKELTPERSDYILSFGERMSVRILAAKLMSRGVVAEAVDANNIIQTDSNFGAAIPDMKRTAKYARKALGPLLGDNITPVVTGFIGSTNQDKITTLGRGGSDYTASILGKVLSAKEVWIWTDVDGVYTSDPRKDSSAQVITEMSQVGAHVMAKAGARVLYPKTVEPLLGSDTILRVKNTFKPQAEGTKIFYK